MASAEHDTKALLESRRQAVDEVAKALLKYETLSGEEVGQIVEGKVLDKPTVGDLLDRERARSAKPAEAAQTPPPVPASGGEAEPIPQPG
jgi:cell division protease FtsH